MSRVRPGAPESGAVGRSGDALPAADHAAPGPRGPRIGRTLAAPTPVRAVVERVVLANEDPFLSLKALADYSGISVRTLWGYIQLPPDDALPCYRLPGGGKILVRRSEFDTWLARFRTRGRPNLARAIRELGLDRSKAA